MLARSIRNTAAALAVAALSASTAIALTPAMARHGWGHHGGWGHHHGWAHRGRGRVLVVPAAYYQPWVSPAYYQPWTYYSLGSSGLRICRGFEWGS
jgi:hypothetical protein